MHILIPYIVINNGLTFILMGADKHKAKNNKWRIPERRLWLCSMIGGAVGSYIGMWTFRHKTKQIPFVIGMPLLAIIHLILLLSRELI